MRVKRDYSHLPIEEQIRKLSFKIKFSIIFGVVFNILVVIAAILICIFTTEWKIAVEFLIAVPLSLFGGFLQVYGYKQEIIALKKKRISNQTWRLFRRPPITNQSSATLKNLFEKILSKLSAMSEMYLTLNKGIHKMIQFSSIIMSVTLRLCIQDSSGQSWWSDFWDSTAGGIIKGIGIVVGVTAAVTSLKFSSDLGNSNSSSLIPFIGVFIALLWLLESERY